MLPIIMLGRCPQVSINPACCHIGFIVTIVVVVTITMVTEIKDCLLTL